MENKEIIDNKTIGKDKKNTNKWYIINLVSFLISFNSLKIGINSYRYLSNMDEYTFGISMIFLVPLFIFLFSIFMLILSITSIIFEGISIKEIIKSNKNIIWKIIGIIEISIYVYYVLNIFRK